MRLDKFLSQHLNISRKQANHELKAQKVTVDGAVVKLGSNYINSDSTVCYNDEQIMHTPAKRYFLLNKPQGYVCTNIDDYNRTVFELLDEPNSHKLHFAGRLDADTTGLVLITDDGQWSHRITKPKHHLPKVYNVILAEPITSEVIETFKQGILLKNEQTLTKPAFIEVINPNEVNLTLYEGKYHQVKRMFASQGNHVVKLHRSQIGDIKLDVTEGDYRPLTEQEINSIYTKKPD